MPRVRKLRVPMSISLPPELDEFVRKRAEEKTLYNSDVVTEAVKMYKKHIEERGE